MKTHVAIYEESLLDLRGATFLRGGGGGGGQMPPLTPKRNPATSMHCEVHVGIYTCIYIYIYDSLCFFNGIS